MFTMGVYGKQCERCQVTSLWWLIGPEIVRQHHARLTNSAWRSPNMVV